MNIPILMYHQVDLPEPKGAKLRGLTVSPASFSSQMALLRLYGYRGVSMHDLEPYLTGQTIGKVVGITFDDGYQNNLTHALPVLSHLGFSSTVYAVSAMPGGMNTWDAHLGVAPAKLMSQEELRAWHRSGQEIGSHTEHHVHLSACSLAQAQEEIVQSKQALEDLIQAPVQHFCYPYGEHNEQLAQLVQAAGYESATTTHRSRVKVGSQKDFYTLPRVPVVRSTMWPQFLLKTMTAYEDRHDR